MLIFSVECEKMADEIAILEKQLDEFEVLLTGGLRLGTDKRLIDRVEQLRTQLKVRCLKKELPEEIVKRPVDQLISLLNVVHNVSSFFLETLFAEFIIPFFSQMTCKSTRK